MIKMVSKKIGMVRDIILFLLYGYGNKKPFFRKGVFMQVSKNVVAALSRITKSVGSSKYVLSSLQVRPVGENSIITATDLKMVYQTLVSGNTVSGLIDPETLPPFPNGKKCPEMTITGGRKGAFLCRFDGWDDTLRRAYVEGRYPTISEIEPDFAPNVQYKMEICLNAQLLRRLLDVIMANPANLDKRGVPIVLKINDPRNPIVVEARNDRAILMPLELEPDMRFGALTRALHPDWQTATAAQEKDVEIEPETPAQETEQAPVAQIEAPAPDDVDEPDEAEGTEPEQEPEQENVSARVAAKLKSAWVRLTTAFKGFHLIRRSDVRRSKKSRTKTETKTMRHVTPPTSVPGEEVFSELDERKRRLIDLRSAGYIVKGIKKRIDGRKIYVVLIIGRR